jgi:hypothetical protein
VSTGRRAAAARRDAGRGAISRLSWSVLAAGLAGCPQSDVVAIERAAADAGVDAGVCVGDAGACGCTRALCPLLTQASASTFCASGGFSAQTGDSCSGSAGGRSYRYALCSCADVTTSAPLEIDAFRGVPTAAVSGAGDVGVDGDLQAGPRLQIPGQLSLTGTASAPAGVLDGITQAQVGTDPCACDDLPDLDPNAGSAVEFDNARAALDERALDGVSGDASLTLACGRYRLSRMAVSGALSLKIQGKVALFVDGNIELDDTFEVTVAEDASLELFVAGNMRVAGKLQLGDSARGQRSLRVHVAGQGTVDLGGISTLAGVLDAPFADLVTRQALTVYGALFVRRLSAEAEVHVRYDTELAGESACGS